MHHSLAKRTKIIVGIPSLVLFSSLVLSNPQSANAAKLYFYPQHTEIFEGESTFIDVRIDTEGDPINAAEIEGSLSSSNLSLVSVKNVNQVFPIFVETQKVNSKSFRYVGGTPTGFTGDDVVGRIEVLGLNPGSGSLSFNNESKVLKHAPGGIALDTSFLDASINVLQRDKSYIYLSSRTHPDQGSWYTENSVNIHWDLSPGSQYSYIVTRDFSQNPDDTPDKPEGSLQFQGDVSVDNLDDGVYYFAVKEVGKPHVYRYRFSIDSTKPSWLNIAISEGIPETENKAFISFAAQDELSGISHYEISIDDSPFSQADYPYQVLPLGFSKVKIRAYDNAGNFVEKTEHSSEPASVNSLYILSLLIIIGLISFFGHKFRLRLKVKK